MLLYNLNLSLSFLQHFITMDGRGLLSAESGISVLIWYKFVLDAFQSTLKNEKGEL